MPVQLLREPTCFAKLTGRAALADDVLVVLGVDADLRVVHGPDQLLGLVLQGFPGLLALVRRSFDLDDITAVRKFNVNLNKTGENE